MDQNSKRDAEPRPPASTNEAPPGGGGGGGGGAISTAFVLQVQESPKVSPTLGKSCGVEAAGAAATPIDPVALAAPREEAVEVTAATEVTAASTGTTKQQQQQQQLGNASWSGSTEVCPWEDE